jgi:hypothetical protein
MIYYRKTLFGSGPKLTAVQALFSLQKKLPYFIGIKSLLSWTAFEWRHVIEFAFVFINYHLTIFVLICMGIVIIAAGWHTKKSL